MEPHSGGCIAHMEQLGDCDSVLVCQTTKTVRCFFPSASGLERWTNIGHRKFAHVFCFSAFLRSRVGLAESRCLRKLSVCRRSWQEAEHKGYVLVWEVLQGRRCLCEHAHTCLRSPAAQSLTLRVKRVWGPFMNHARRSSCHERQPLRSSTDGVSCACRFSRRTRQRRLSLSLLQCSTSMLLLVCLRVQVARVVVVGRGPVSLFWRTGLLTGPRAVRRPCDGAPVASSVDWTTRGVMTPMKNEVSVSS